MELKIANIIVGCLYPGLVGGALEMQHLAMRGGNTSSTLRFRRSAFRKNSISGLLVRNGAVGIATYVRNDNADDVYQVESVNAFANARRLNSSLESIWGELYVGKWLSIGFWPGP